MSEFRFICPSCDTPLDCPEELDGVETECPVCHAAIVPTISKDVFSECSEAEELQKEIDEQKEEFLQEQEQEQEFYPFIAKCPACKKVIELKEELKYSKQQCPFCNKTVLLNTVKNQNNNQSPRPIKTEKEKVASKIISESIKFNDYLTKNTPDIFNYVMIPLACICFLLFMDYSTHSKFTERIMYHTYNWWTGAADKHKAHDAFIQRTRKNIENCRAAKERFDSFTRDIEDFANNLLKNSNAAK